LLELLCACSHFANYAPNLIHQPAIHSDPDISNPPSPPKTPSTPSRT
jgi:hypothetical protein